MTALLGADIQITNPLLQRYIDAEFVVEPTIGLILQAGADIHLWGRVQARVDLKYLSLSANTHVNKIQFKSGLPLIGDVDLGDALVKATAHAWLGQLGRGFDFDL